MNDEQAAKLRAPFKAEQIGKLPKVNCKACVEANKKNFGATCEKHRKVNCDTCGNWISERHIHLDYVGHAGVTDRLLQVDPDWTWEFAPEAPMLGEGLWIKLTVCGVTRYGFGDGKNPKELIGDAIRNAAMRFGVGLDLWAKEDLRGSDENVGAEGQDNPPVDGSNGAAAREPTGPAPTTSWQPPPIELHNAKALVKSLVARGISVHDARKRDKLPPLSENMDEADFRLFQKVIEDLDVANPVA